MVSVTKVTTTRSEDSDGEEILPATGRGRRDLSGSEIFLMTRSIGDDEGLAVKMMWRKGGDEGERLAVSLTMMISRSKRQDLDLSGLRSHEEDNDEVSILAAKVDGDLVLVSDDGGDLNDGERRRQR